MQRILLVTDGTVTHIVEAYAGEPIQVVKLEQSVGTWASQSPDISLSEDEPVVRRRVLLRGSRSQTNYVYAESLILTDRLAPRVRDELISTEDPIGKILTGSRTETFREVIRSGRQPAEALGQYFGLEPSDILIFRTYTIAAGARPIMVITERFPLSSFQSVP
jgi:chorismate-pyruvate lyase